MVLAGYFLLAPPLFVLAPFLLLTLISGPRTLRELLWLVVAGAGLGLSLQGAAGLVGELIRALGLVLGFGFVGLSLRWRVALTARSLLAVCVTAIVVGLWEWSRGVSWPALQQVFTSMLREGYQQMATPGGPGTATRPEVQSFVQPFIDRAADLATGLPGLLALEGLAGVALAWLWHHKIAVTPLGEPPARFRDFRFNDHLIWGAIFTLALLLAPLPTEATVLAKNLLILWIGLYALRGLAVAASFFAAAPAPLRILTALLAAVLSPLTLGGCLALGLADTWLDLRGRLPPPVTGGA